MRVVVFGGTGLVGSHTCKALLACGCAVTSISRGGLRAESQPLLGESWVSQVDWQRADAAEDGAAAKVLEGGVDGVVSCIGSGDLQHASAEAWNGWAWSDKSIRQWRENSEPNLKVVAAAKAAGVRRFAFVGVSSDSERGFGGPNPGLYSGKRAAALAARDAFGAEFTYFGPSAVAPRADDPRIKTLNGGLGRGLNAVNDFIGEIRSFGPDYTTSTRLAPPVPAADLALAIAACLSGSVAVEESVRASGMTLWTDMSGGSVTCLEREQTEIRDAMRHVDGTAAILELAERARRAELDEAAAAAAAA